MFHTKEERRRIPPPPLVWYTWRCTCSKQGANMQNLRLRKEKKVLSCVWTWEDDADDGKDAFRAKLERSRHFFISLLPNLITKEWWKIRTLFWLYEIPRPQTSSLLKKRKGKSALWPFFLNVEVAHVIFGFSCLQPLWSYYGFWRSWSPPLKAQIAPIKKERIKPKTRK